MKKILFYAAALAVVLASCSQKDMTDKTPETEKQGTAFEGTSEVNTGENPLSRTSLDYDRAARTLTYYWEPNDKIWLDDNNSAEADFTVKAATGRFTFTSGTFNAPNYNVYYTGTNGTSHNTVNIATTQTQGTPNTTSHIGTYGDCGTALATRTSAGKYGFTLTHRSAYLCFLPRTTNATGTGWVLTAVKVTSDNNIAGNYTLTPTGLTGTGSSNEITLNTGNFDITNTTTDQARNASYMVIAPGTHTLTVEYTVKNTISGNTGTIVKHLDAKDYHANTLYPVTAHLFEDYSNTKYYLWDAQEDMWFGKTAIDYNTGKYNTDDAPKWLPLPPSNPQPDATRLPHFTAPNVPGWTFSHGYGNTFQYATQSAKDCPNVWELAWYYDKGDVRWDDATVFAFRGKFYRGGVWIKKQKVIADENSTTVAALKNTYPGVQNDPESLIHPDAGGGVGPQKSIGHGIPSATEIKKYFYLPALGEYREGGGLYHASTGILTSLGIKGFYTCSSAYCLTSTSIGYQWTFDFDNTTLHLNSGNTIWAGNPLWKAK